LSPTIPIFYDNGRLLFLRCLLIVLITPNISPLVTNLVPNPERQEKRYSGQKQHNYANDYPVKDGKFAHILLLHLRQALPSSPSALSSHLRENFECLLLFCCAELGICGMGKAAGVIEDPAKTRGVRTALRAPMGTGDNMTGFLRTVEFLALSLWLGSDVFLSFVVAPGAFRVLASRDQAGAMVGYGLYWMHMIGVVCGVVLLVARIGRVRSLPALLSPVVLCVALMIGLTVVSQHGVSPKMAALRLQMCSIEATAKGSPLLAEFARLHRLSVSLESGVLLAGLLGMYFMVRELGVSR
jgi:uncharacterized membrane protein